MLRRILYTVLLAVTGCALLCSCQRSRAGVRVFESDELQFRTPSAEDPVAIFDTSLGEIRAVLFPEQAPLAVENFVSLAQEGFYDELTFHRVIEDFLIQSGDPTGTGTGGQSIWGEPFDDEISDALHNYTGALSMSNVGEDSNTSQFFIVATGADTVSEELAQQMTAAGWRQEVVDAYRSCGGAPYLDSRCTVFGQVYQGMEVVYEIAAQATDENDKPRETILLNSVQISEYGQAG